MVWIYLSLCFWHKTGSPIWPLDDIIRLMFREHTSHLHMCVLEVYVLLVIISQFKTLSIEISPLVLWSGGEQVNERLVEGGQSETASGHDFIQEVTGMTAERGGAGGCWWLPSLYNDRNLVSGRRSENCWQHVEWQYSSIERRSFYQGNYGLCFWYLIFSCSLNEKPR